MLANVTRSMESNVARQAWSVFAQNRAVLRKAPVQPQSQPSHTAILATMFL